MCVLIYLDHFRNGRRSYQDTYKDIMREMLSEEDFEDFTEGLTNYDHYDFLDDEIKMFVDSYYKQDITIDVLRSMYGVKYYQ